MPWTEIRGPGGQVPPAVTTSGPLGTTKTYFLGVDQEDPSGATEVLTSTTGWKRLIIYPLGALASATPIYVGYSTTASDDAAVVAQINAAISGITGGQTGYDVMVLTPDYPVTVLDWDGTTTIKTVASETTSADKTLCVIGIS